MNTVNETGRQAGRYLYRTHEVSSNGAVSVVDLKTGEAKVIAQRADWRRLDGVRWTPGAACSSPRRPTAAGSSSCSSTGGTARR